MGVEGRIVSDIVLVDIEGRGGTSDNGDAFDIKASGGFRWRLETSFTRRTKPLQLDRCVRSVVRRVRVRELPRPCAAVVCHLDPKWTDGVSEGSGCWRGAAYSFRSTSGCLEEAVVRTSSGE